MKKSRLEKENLISALYEPYLKAKEYFPDSKRDADTRYPDFLEDKLALAGPENTVVVTGSKGKGSLSRMIAAVLGIEHTTGLFISPHVLDFNERISVDFCSISDVDLEKYMSKALKDAKACGVRYERGEYVSPIGILALTAVRYFASKNCEYRVFECGRGARFDDVNRIPHEYAVIGSVFLEHQAQLGDTFCEIAYEKACVITEDTKTVYSMPQEKEVLDVIRERAVRMGAKLLVCGEDFEIRPRELSLLGSYQIMHAAIAEHLAREMLDGMGVPSVADTDRALKAISIPGRMELLSEDPFIFMDCAINRQSAVEVSEYLRINKIKEGILIACLPDDKDFIGVIGEVSKYFNKIFLSKIPHPHYPMEVDQGILLEREGICTETENDFKMALKRALEYGKPIVILCANTFVDIIKDFVRLHKDDR